MISKVLYLKGSMMKKHILVIGSDRVICDTLQMALRDEDIVINFVDSSTAIGEVPAEPYYCLLIWDSQHEMLLHSYSTKRFEKPVDIEVCAEQIRSIIQKTQSSWKDYALLTFGSELVIDQRHHTVIVDEMPMPLTPIEFNLLLYMAENPEQVFSIEQLYMHIWSDIPNLGSEKTVRVHLSNLRKKFTVAGKGYIQNVRGVGYRFVPPAKKNYKIT